MLITSVEKNSKNNDRISVYVDGTYLFSVSEEDYIRFNLYEEREIMQEEIDYIQKTVNFNSAKYLAVKYVALKIRTEKEVQKRLEYNGYDCRTVQSVINELKAMGYLNDKMYAQKYIYDRSKLKPKSKRLLKAELQNKGIPTDIIDRELDELEIDEAVLAASLIRKKFGKYDLKDEKIVKKMYSFLKHRGFGFGLIEEAIGSINMEEH